MYCNGGTDCFSYTLGRHSVFVIGINQKIASIMRKLNLLYLLHEFFLMDRIFQSSPDNELTVLAESLQDV